MPMTLLSVPWRCLRILPLRCQRWPARLLKSTIDPTRLMCALSGLRGMLIRPLPQKAVSAIVSSIGRATFSATERS